MGSKPLQTDAPKAAQVPLLERILVILAAVACVFLTIGIWRSVSGSQSTWPLPGLYFIELPAAALASLLTFLREDSSSAMTAWITAGIVTAFSVIGAFSIGLFYLPIAIRFIMLAVLATVRQGLSVLRGVGAFLAAVLGQAVIMFLFINLLYAAQRAGP